MGDRFELQNMRSLARDLYAVYCASADGKNYQGLPCPAWDDLTEAVRGHWTTVALRARQLEGLIVIGRDGTDVTARTTPPDDLAIGHLPDPAHALEVWQRYSGLAG